MSSLSMIVASILVSQSPVEAADGGAVPEPRFEVETIDEIEIGYGIAIGDVDGDGKPDILLADKRHFAWYRNPDWTRFVMCDGLTPRDNVCVAARDINGDNQVEVAVGAQWNPGDTSDPEQSGSIHYLDRPDDPTETWTPYPLEHDPTVHRIRWVRVRDTYRLVVLPLHGIDNQDGAGRGVRVWSYAPVASPASSDWERELLDASMHLTHNLDVIDIGGRQDRIIIAGREGLLWMDADSGNKDMRPPGVDRGAGEVRFGRPGPFGVFVATIEPMHGDSVVVRRFTRDGWTQHVLDSTLAQGHALACGDLLGLGRDQVVAGWRNRNADGHVGIRLYVPTDETGTAWITHPIDVGDSMACEDLRLADLDGDGRLDIIAAGRATRNLNIYWNRTDVGPADETP